MFKIKNPNQCLLSITEKCNFSCIHCFTDSSKKLENVMSLDLFKNCIQQLNDLGVIWINLTGGEPLLHPKIKKILEIAFSFGEQHIFTLLSNGSNWNDDLITLIEKDYKKHQLKIQFSIDGFDYQTFSSIRKGSTINDFENLIDVILKLKQRNHHITVFHTVTKKTLGNALETARFVLEKLNVNQVVLDPLFISGRAKKNFNELVYSYDEWKELLRHVTIIKRDNLWGSLSKRLQMTFFTFYELVIPLKELGMEQELKEIWHFDEEVFFRYRPIWCEAGVTDLCINSRGDVFPCVPAISTNFVAGNIQEQSLSEIWFKSDLFNWFREIQFEVIKKEPCIDCEFKRICGGGCRISAQALLNDRTAPDPRCPKVRDYLKYYGEGDTNEGRS
ncbi:hypothetical protein BBF96_14805 [Anoxybacter fermentans]|uniref:Radical SAM core domain-containing protein n=1 Tax=Anoxybacter fermentans TaxID=1323375 RepID=A0A3S9T1V8_9FIRM|nr:radical SAM protein [Anoxybacter fermentans]AZR74544.1 hypothetical protein BBF96_14805 [Anoxybacter fermentans]